MREVVIVGAGPAGCVAGVVLARARCAVTLVEQHRFPRDKVCGECVSALGWEVLERLELSPVLRRHGAVPLRRCAVRAPDGQTAWVALPQPMWGLSRGILDATLLEAARGAGCRLMQPARCEAVSPGPTPRLTVRDLQSNEIVDLHADAVVVADGKSALLTSRPQATHDFGLKAHFTRLAAARDAIELFGVNGHYGGVAPVEGGLWNVAFSVPRRRIARRNDLDGLFAEILKENKTLGEHFRRGRRVNDWMVSPLPRFGVRRRWPPGIVPVGNAAAALEPIGGEGMGLAMRSAELAARRIASSPLAAIDAEALRTEFRELWTRRRFFSRTAALCVSEPLFCAAAVNLLSISNSLRSLALNWLGKSPSAQNA